VISDGVWGRQAEPRGEGKAVTHLGQPELRPTMRRRLSSGRSILNLEWKWSEKHPTSCCMYQEVWLWFGGLN